MHMRARVLATLAGLVLALTMAAPAAWAMPHYNGTGGNTSTDVTGNNQGGYTSTTTTTNGSSTTTQASSTASNGSYTSSQSTTNNSTGQTQATSTSYNGTTGTTTQSTTTTTSPGNSSTTTVATDSSGNQTRTTSTTTNGQTTSVTTVTAVSNGTSTVQQGSMVILSTSQNAQTQDNPLVNGATVITLPQPTAGESEAQYQQTLAQWLQANPSLAQDIQTAQLAVTTGGTGWVSSVMNQALADITNNTVLEIGGSNAVTGAQMLVQAANIFASSGLSGLESNLSTLASLAGGTGSATDPWAGNGYASNAGSGTAGVSLYQPSSVGFAGATGTGGGGSCPPGEIGSPPNCYTPIHNPPPPPSNPSSQWYAIAVPAWMNSWLNIGQQSLGNGDQTASTAKNSGQDTGSGNSSNYVPTAPAGANMLQGGPVATLSNESAQVYGTYTVTSTQTETEYKTVTVPEEETRMVAETQTVPGYWHNVAVNQPGYYTTEDVNHPGYYTTETVQHPGHYTTQTIEHPAHTGVTYVDGRPHAVYHPAYTTTEHEWHAAYTTSEEIYHPGYTTAEQVYHPATTAMQSEWVPPTTATVEVPQTYTAYVQQQQAYTVNVPVTHTEIGWHTVTSTVASNTVLSSGNPGGQQDTAVALYVAPVSGSSNPWIE